MRDEVLERLVREIVDLRSRVAGLETQERGRSPVLIQSTTLSGAAASVTFDSIPQTFWALILDWYARADLAGQVEDYLALQINDDTGNNYDVSEITSEPSTNSVYSWEFFGGDWSYFATVPAATATANLFGAGRLYIPGYRLAGNKIARASWDYKRNTSTDGLRGGEVTLAWRSNNAITKIELFLEGASNVIAGSQFVLLGVP